MHESVRLQRLLPFIVTVLYTRLVFSRLKSQVTKLARDNIESETKHFNITLIQVQNCYRIKNKGQLDTRIPITRLKELQPGQVQSIGYLGNTVEEAAVCAAYKISEAENKSFVAAEAVKEAERVSTMAADMESLLQFATDCFDQSISSKFLLISSYLFCCVPCLLQFCDHNTPAFSLHAGRCVRRNFADGIGSNIDLLLSETCK